MAKKSSKSTRRARSKKEQAPKKKVAAPKQQTAPEELVIITEGSAEPVAKIEKKLPAKKPVSKKPKTVEMLAADNIAAQEAVEEMVQPTRNRMLVSAVALAVIVIALIFGAGIMRQSEEQKAAEITPSTQGSAAADDILQSGGKMCTNQQATSDTSGSSNPQSVGMMLQSNPTSSLQTPQTFGGGGSDAAALQGASCF